MTLSTKIEVLTDFTFVFAAGLHRCTAVARSLCVSWAFLLLLCCVYLAVLRKSVRVMPVAVCRKVGTGEIFLFVSLFIL